MPFLAKLDLDASSDARRSRRFLTHHLDGMLVGKDRRFDIIIHNMSETGFLAEFQSELRVGDLVRVQLAQLGFVDARVVRKRGMGHGCQFVEPVSSEIVRETIAGSVGFAEGSRPGERTTPASDEEQRGYRRRARRERIGAFILLGCTLAAVAILAAALIRILTA